MKTMKNNIFVSKNPYLCKKDFYVTELKMGIDGLEDVSDYKGPFKTLKSAQIAFKKFIMKDKFLNHWDFAIRGKQHLVGQYKTIFYKDGTLKKYN